ncbi:hypothetical protein [Burkholderia glumae]|uniref:Uncharacterized protein n=1 Tax=Burkholderia glumae TaxID=337 RepID=A0AAQ0BQS4_BURGL|nr:hypothetical protein [Burkholderia glumae]ACR32181.1 Hypothetical protein bglu_2g18550 [Burkholderia glumae BGR1]AJY62987.1 hypothetical protein KS03_4079 [Burkholderia glumae LMG 2196 = ATCC 33617]KHJ63880.1 hypothetical protein NCPPB3923_05805 [Burkholderia glumae]MCM2484635.1 hypothetical protein [Burkholderia glumae]MCM2495016.1 hypothetical protein [Burkholderia glumae]
MKHGPLETGARQAREQQADAAALCASLSPLERSLMREALLLLIDSRRQALALTEQVCRQRHLAAPSIQDFHLPTALRLLREFGAGGAPGEAGDEAARGAP